MDSIFRQSSLYRKKYDEKHGKTTYGIALLNKAINETSNVFNPHQPLNVNYDMSFLNKDRDKPKTPRTWDDMGNALRFIDMYGDNFKYSYIDKMWYLYNGSYWQIDQSGRKVCRQCNQKYGQRKTQHLAWHGRKRCYGKVGQVQGQVPEQSV